MYFLLFRVAGAPEVKMPASNIAKVFGPTIVGYSSADPDQHAIFTETMIQANVSRIVRILCTLCILTFFFVGHGKITKYSIRVLE